jgi:hypothetical protein
MSNTYKQEKLENGLFLRVHWNGTIAYTSDGKVNYHNPYGPALEYPNGDKIWCINGEEYSEEEFNVIKEVLLML